MFTHIPSVPFLLFLFSFLPSHFFRLSSLHPRREVVPYIQLRDLGSAVSIYWPVPPRHKTSHRISLIDHVVTVPDLERRTFNNCYEGPSLPGAGHVSPSVRGGDMDITGRQPDDSGSLLYEISATDLRYSLDRPHQQRDSLMTYRSRVSWRANC